MIASASAPGRRDWLIFALLFLAYAYFFQGGGWNQNSRFDQLRAVVEQGRFSINDFMLYVGDPESGDDPTLRRLTNTPGTPLARIRASANTGDVAYVDPGGRYYPNKPPGSTLLALPAYLAIHAFERLAGLDPDSWRVMTANHYLVTVFSVGLIGALGGLLFLRVSRVLLPDAAEWTHLASAVCFGAGTLVFPFATALYDHVEAAVLLLASLYFLLRAGAAPQAGRRGSVFLLLGGVAAGMSVVVNYLCAPAVLALTAYAFWRFGFRARTATFLLGGAPFVLFLAGYHHLCFGSPFATANSFENEMFKAEGLFFGAFGLPRADVAWKLILGTRRGLLVTSPVLLFAAIGAFSALKDRRTRPVVLLCAVVFALYWVANASFEHWHSGFSVGARYMIPALPFLCLWLARSFEMLPRLTLLFGVISVAMMLLATAVDAQVPSVYANPLIEYLWPLVRDGSVTIQNVVVEGPVSANPIGSWEGWYYRVFPAGSSPARWSSFNLGEFIWPRSLLSLLPLVLILGSGFWMLGRGARR